MTIPSKWARMDWPLLLNAVALCAIGLCAPSLYIFACLSGSQARLVEVLGFVAGLLMLITLLLIRTRLGERSIGFVYAANTAGAIAGVLLAAASFAASAAFPEKPVRIVVPFPPGGGTDIVARLLGARLTELWSQPVVVENRAGASGTIGTEIAARADPDGHALFMATMGNMTANQHLYQKMAVDPLRAFAPVTKVVDVHFVFLANPALAASNVRELIEHALKRETHVDRTMAAHRAAGGRHLLLLPGEPERDRLRGRSG